MVSDPWGPTGLAITALLLILYSDRLLSWHSDTLGRGREFIWKTRFRESISELVCYLDDELDLLQNVERYRNWANADPSNPQDLVVEYSDDLADQIPYTGDIRRLTSAIGDNAEQISTLEDYYHELPSHVRIVGITLLVIDGAWVLSDAAKSNTEVPAVMENSIWLIPILVIYIAYHAYILNEKQSTLREYSRKFEEIDEP